MSENPKKAIIEESGKCIGWVCMTCSRLHTTAIYLAKDDEAEAAALDAANRCCMRQPCACGAETSSTYSTQCSNCWRAEHDAKDLAKWEAAPKQTIAEYLADQPDGFVNCDDRFWPVSDYVDDEVYLQHPRVYFCEPMRGIKLAAEDCVESWADDRHEDAIEELDLTELQTLLDAWCAKQDTVSWYATGTALHPAEVERLCREAAKRDARDGEQSPVAAVVVNE